MPEKATSSSIDVSLLKARLPDFGCAECRHRGWLNRTDEIGCKLTRPCPCRERILTIEETMESMLACGIPRKHLSKLQIPWAGPNAKPVDFWRWCEPDHGEPFVYHLDGDVGRGKTKAAVRGMFTFLRKKHRGAYFGRAGLIAEKTMEDRRSDAPQFERMLRTIPFLILDDVGTERSVHAAVIEELLFLREEAEKRTVVTTNVKTFKEGDNLRLLSRLKEAGVHEFKGIDMRGRVAA